MLCGVFYAFLGGNVWFRGIVEAVAAFVLSFQREETDDGVVVAYK